MRISAYNRIHQTEPTTNQLPTRSPS